MKSSLAATLLAVASASAHIRFANDARHVHLAGRQNPSLAAGSSLSSSSTSSSVIPSVSTPTLGTTSQTPPSTITGAPGAVPINQITSGMSSGTPDLPTTTYSPGSTPTWSGAPPLPSCT